MLLVLLAALAWWHWLLLAMVLVIIEIVAPTFYFLWIAVAAGLMTSRKDSPVARVLDGMLAARFPFALSEALLAEYRIVLSRPKLRELHGLGVDELESLLAEIVRHAIFLEPVSAPPAPDPNDQMLWDLLAVRLDLVLVSGDRALLLDEGMSGRVVSAARFVEVRTSP